MTRWVPALIRPTWPCLSVWDCSPGSHIKVILEGCHSQREPHTFLNLHSSHRNCINMLQVSRNKIPRCIFQKHTFLTWLCLSWFHKYQSYQTSLDSYTFTKCLRHWCDCSTERWHSSVGNNIHHCTVSHVSRPGLDVFVCGLHPLCHCPPPATILNWFEPWPWWWSKVSCILSLMRQWLCVHPVLASLKAVLHPSSPPASPKKASTTSLGFPFPMRKRNNKKLSISRLKHMSQNSIICFCFIQSCQEFNKSNTHRLHMMSWLYTWNSVIDRM